MSKKESLKISGDPISFNNALETIVNNIESVGAKELTKRARAKWRLNEKLGIGLTSIHYGDILGFSSETENLYYSQLQATMEFLGEHGAQYKRSA